MDGLRDGLKEYASVITAAVAVIAALAVLGFVGHQRPGHA